MNDRIKELRKALGLSGEKFGEPLGIKRAAVSNLELGRTSVTEQMIKSICYAYNVNEDWLRTGQGNMFLETEKSFLDTLAKQYNLEDLDLKILSGYMNLSPDERAVIKNYIKSITD